MPALPGSYRLVQSTIRHIRTKHGQFYKEHLSRSQGDSAFIEVAAQHIGMGDPTHFEGDTLNEEKAMEPDMSRDVQTVDMKYQ